MEIRVVMLEWEDPVLYTKGHVNKPQFLAAAAAYVKEHTEDDYEKPECAHYVWIRYSPDPSGEHSYLVIDGTPGKQGTFPATMSYVPDRRYPPAYKTWPKMPGQAKV